MYLVITGTEYGTGTDYGTLADPPISSGSESSPDAVETSGRDAYVALRQRARDLIDAGDLRAALETLERALEEAKRLGDADRIDRALCNRMAVAISLGDHVDTRAPLRAVLMRRTSDGSAFLASIALARAYEASKSYKKGLFYAQVAQRHAQATEDERWLASALNYTGNCLVGDSHFERASEAYREALDLLPEAPSALRANILTNLGYCAATSGRVAEAFDFAFRSLRWFRRLGDQRGCGWAHLDLCFAYSQHGCARRSTRHGRRALALAERSGEAGLIKNALFMLGGAEQEAGDIDAAYDCFDRLQRAFYPDQPQLVELMLAVDLRQIVNLRA